MAFGNPSITWSTLCGEDRGTLSFTLVGCKSRCQGGLASVYASMLRIFVGVTNISWSDYKLGVDDWGLLFG